MEIHDTNYTWRMRMKNKLANFLITLGTSLNEDWLKINSITDKVDIDFSKFAPADGKWRHCAATVQYWYKDNRSSMIKKEDVYLDGVEVSSTLREIVPDTKPQQ
jgi:hypothetical protein